MINIFLYIGIVGILICQMLAERDRHIESMKRLDQILEEVKNMNSKHGR